MNLAEITEGRPWLGRMGLAAFLFFLVKGACKNIIVETEIYARVKADVWV